MLDDLQRLDTLINHMLDAARLDQQPVETDLLDVELSAVLKNCAETVCLRYHLPPDTVRLSTSEAIVRARPIDLEIVFRNLVDNAIKYGGATPRVEIDSQFTPDDRIVTRIVRQRTRHSAKAAAQDFRAFRASGQRAGAIPNRHRSWSVYRAYAGETLARPDCGARPPWRTRHDLRSRTARSAAPGVVAGRECLAHVSPAKTSDKIEAHHN